MGDTACAPPTTHARRSAQATGLPGNWSCSGRTLALAHQEPYFKSRSVALAA